MNTFKKTRTWLILSMLVVTPVCLSHDDRFLASVLRTQTAGTINRAPAVLPESADGLSPAENLGEMK